jgi:hypothetical protein
MIFEIEIIRLEFELEIEIGIEFYGTMLQMGETSPQVHKYMYLKIDGQRKCKNELSSWGVRDQTKNETSKPKTVDLCRILNVSEWAKMSC